MRRLLTAAVLAGSLLVAAPAVQAAEPIHVHWESLLPQLVAPGDGPGRLAECGRVRIACVDRVAAHLHARSAALGCDHRAIFPEIYARLTEQLRKAIATRGYFVNNRFLIQEVVLFSRLLDRSFDGFYVPEAWRIAFDAWKQGDTVGVQDLLLGINAHVQRDMPYVVAAMGLGVKSDHDKVNEVLDAAFLPIVKEVTQRYDPLTNLSVTLSPVTDVMGIELVRVWREGVWRNAEGLLAAHTPAEKALVEQRIETVAAASARVIALPRYPGYGPTRDAYCRSAAASRAGTRSAR